MINTYNETDLHKFFKQKYCEKFNGKTEVKIGNYVCDIFTEPQEIIEIQTSSLCKLVPKINELSKDFKITVVFPFAFAKTIEHFSESGDFLYKRKSPVKNNWIKVFAELNEIIPLVEQKKIVLEIVAISVVETRIHTEAPVQSKNNRRHYKKNWYKSGKRMEEILETKRFYCKKDFASLLPFKKGEQFSGKDFPKFSSRFGLHRALSVLCKAEIIKNVGKKGNLRVFEKA